VSVLTSNASVFYAPKTTTLARGFVLVGLIFLMLNVPLLNKCYALAVIPCIFSSFFRDTIKTLLQEPIIRMGLVLVILFTIGLFYSYGSLKYGLRFWDKYLKIFYLLLFIPLFIKKATRNQALCCFLISVMISEILTYIHHFGWYSFGLPAYKHWPFVQEIDASFIVSYAAYLFMLLALTQKKLRWLFVTCFLICSIDVLFLNIERTGYLVYLGLAALLLLQCFRWQGLLSAVLIMPLLFTILYFSSHPFNDRVNQIASNIMAYQKGDPGTSIGLRLTFTEYSLKMVRHHPLFGLGTGSFEEVYRSLEGPKINNETWPSHPHNEFINILFQIGLIGLLAFIYWIFLQARVSFQLPQAEKMFLQGLILAFLLLSMCNASLLVNPAGACYMTLLAVFLASKYDKEALVCKSP
jgi:O-antigen ligase